MKYLEEGCKVRINNQLHCLIVKMFNIIDDAGKSRWAYKYKSRVSFACQTKLWLYNRIFLLSVKQKQLDSAK